MSPEARRGLAATAGAIAVVTLVARVVGFGRWLAFSHSVGATCTGTVYQSVNAVPNVLYEIAAGGVLATIVVPLVAGALARGAREQADVIASALLTWSLLVLVPIAIAIALAAEPISRALLTTACPGEVALGAHLLRIFAPQVPLYGVAIVVSAVLAAHHRFLGAALAPLLSSLVVIATYLAYGALVPDAGADIADVPTSAVTLLGVGTTLGVLTLGLPLVWPLVRAQIRVRPRLRLPSGVGSRLRGLAVAGVLAVAGQQVAMLGVIRLAGDHGGPGVLNVWTYAQAVMLLPYAVLAVPIATTAFPALARGQEVRDLGTARADAAHTLSRAWRATLVVGCLGTALVVAVAWPVAAFFARLDAGASSGLFHAMPFALCAFAPSVLGLGVVAVLSRAGYVRGSATLVGAVVGLGWLLGLVASFVILAGSTPGPTGTLVVLAAGPSLGQLAAALVLTFIAARRWGTATLALPLRPAGAVILGSGAGATVAAFIGRLGVSQDGGVSLVLAAGVAVVAAALCLLVTVAVVAALDRPLLRHLGSVVPRRGRAGAP